MPLDEFPLVNPGEIISLVGQASFERGRKYSSNDSVRNMMWDPNEDVLTSSVRGTDPQPYSVVIELVPVDRTSWRPKYTACTCHMGYDCKHVAATLVESSTIHLVERARGEIPDGMHIAPEPQELAPKPRAKPVPKWKTTLIPPAPAAQKPAGNFGYGYMEPPAETDVPMALQLEVRELMPKSRGRWRAPTQAVTADMVEASAGAKKPPVYRLAARPVMRSSSTGNWIKGNLSWNSISYQAARFGLDADQARWFTQFAALYTSGSPAAYSHDPDWFYLDAFDSPLFWNLLEQAEVLGIELVASKKTVAVVLGSRVELRLDASTAGVTPTKRTAAPVQLTSRLLIDGAEHRTDLAGTIGSHGVYAFSLGAPAAYTLARTSAPLGDEQRALLGRPATVTVPGRDVDEFLTDYFPRLRRTIEITSADESVPLPEFAPPVLVATATFGPGQTLALHWEWEYRQGAAVLALPLRENRDDQLEQFERDAETEKAAVSGVERAIAASPALAGQLLEVFGALQSDATLAGLHAAEFTARILPFLQQWEGVRVDVIGDMPDYRELTETPKLTIKTQETDYQDWFDLGVLISIDGRDIPFGPLFVALSAGEEMILLEDDSFLSLRQDVFVDLKKLIDEASNVSEWETAPRISRYQASLWADLEDLAETTEQAAAWTTAVSGLLDLGSVEPVALPAGIRAELRPYQHEGFEWLVFLWKNQLGGVLADDMGLGKTLQSLALISHAVASQSLDADHNHVDPDASGRAPFLVVAPTSVVSNWKAEAARFAPDLAVSAITTTQSAGGSPLAGQFLGADIVITSYALFRLDFDNYQAQQWSGLILDEAQFVKNPASIAHARAVELRAPFKLAITGTPMENSLTDLWSLFSIVAPGLFPSGKRFTEDYVKPITKGDDDAGELMARLRRRIRPLMMRRTKELVAKDLPAKQEQVLRIDLAPKHKKLYDTYLQRERKKLLGLIDDMNKNRFMVFRSLTLLRMLSLDASLVDPKYSDIPSSKLDALFEQLEDVVAEGHRALIFSQFTSFLTKAAERLDAEGIAYAYLDGSTLRRGDVIEGFKSGTAPVFLISLKAGGFGLNLTEADYVFLLDPWWNPATEAQAVDRTHRIGQTNNVMVYRMIATDTIEEKVMALKEKKSKLFDAVMDDDAVFSQALTADDIRGLLD